MDDDVLSPNPLIITRAEARAKGLKRYFLGPNHPCPKGHIAERAVSGECVACNNARRKAHYDGNVERERQRVADYAAANPDKVRAARAKWYSANSEKARKYSAEYAAGNPEKAKAYRKANRERLRELNAGYRAANREKVNKQARDLRAKDPEKHRQARRKHYAANREKQCSLARQWVVDNPEKARALWRNRAARQKSAEGRHTAADIQRIYEAQKGKCACCRRKVGADRHVDHIVPLSRGGSNWPNNLQLCCPPCNGRKYNKDPIEFMQSQGLLL
jgi:5-methylcytosine-specific restriction endonuclease McrA